MPCKAEVLQLPENNGITLSFVIKERLVDEAAIMVLRLIFMKINRHGI
jgi:hypothetical protein